jgi:Lipopolysaccharide-assembly
MRYEKRRTKNEEVPRTRQVDASHFFVLHSSFLVCLLLALSGCAGYHVGTAGLFPSDIHTVFVPMFESDSFRRDLGEQLTEAVCKEIEARGPMKVVGTPNADSVLTGRITTDTKHALFREPNNEARDIETGMVIRVSFADRHGNILHDGQVPLPPEMIDINQTAHIIPEYGSSTISAQQQLIKRLAKQVVDLMESPW